MTPASTRAGRGRRILVVALVVISSLAAPLAVVGSWSRRNVLDTERFVSRVGPAIEEPEVQDAVAGFVTREVMQLIDQATLFTEALEDRPRAQLLAVPLAGVLENFIRDKVDEVVSSEGFANLWNGVIERVHTAALRILEDESQIVSTDGDTVQLDFVPVIRAVLDRVAEAAPDVLGEGSALRDRLEAAEPGEIATAIEDALGVEIPDNFGQVTLQGSGQLERIQQALSTFEKLVWVLWAIALAAAIGAIGLSRSRRRTGLQLVVGLAVGALVLRRASFRVQEAIEGAADTAPALGSVGVIVDSFLEPLQTFAAWALGVLAVVAAVLLITGPYGWAVRIRSAGWGAWFAAHRQQVAMVGGAIGVLVLWFADLGWFGILVVLAGTGAALYELLSSDESPPTGPDALVAAPGR